MIVNRKLSGGGDKEHEIIANTAATVGCDVIELLWLPRNRLPHFGIPRVAGYKKPLLDRTTVSFDDPTVDGIAWIDSDVKFYPDENGFCYGLIFDCEDNRKLLASSLSTNWFKIIDKRVRDEVIALAKELGFDTEPAQLTEMRIKKSRAETELAEKAKKLEDKLEEATLKLRMLEKEHERTLSEVNKNTKNKLSGIKLPVVEEPIKE